MQAANQPPAMVTHRSPQPFAPLLDPKGRTRRAFTLIELSLVVAILGIIAAIAIPRYGSARATFRSRSAAIRVATDLNHASSLAKARSISVSVVFSPDGASYDTVIDPGGSGSLDSTFTLTAHPYFATISPASLPAGSSITFDGFGRPDSNPTIEVQAAQRRTSLSIDANGRASVSTP